MTKYKNMLMPFISCDIPAIESWLGDMARQGYLYESSGTFTVRFSVSDPTERRYRLEYADVTGRQIKSEKREMYEACGWTVADDIMSGFVVLYTDDAEAPEPYDAQETIKPLEKIRTRQLIVGILFIALLFATVKIGAPVASLISGDRDVLLTLLTYGTGRYILLVLLAVLLLGEGIFRIVRSHRLKKYIEALKKQDGTPKLTRKNAIGTLLILLTAPLIVAWAVQLVFFHPGRTTYYATNQLDGYPFPMLAQINEEEGQLLAQLCDPHGGIGVSSLNSRDLLAPAMTAFNVEYYPEFSYYAQYYEMRNEKLAQRLYEEMVYSFSAYSQSELTSRNALYRIKLKNEGSRIANEFLNQLDKDYTIDELSVAGADAATHIVDQHDYSTPQASFDGKHYQYLILRRGNELVHVQYLGRSDLKDCAPLYADYLAR